MESWPQNPEFRINPENLHPCSSKQVEIAVENSNAPCDTIGTCRSC